MESTERARRVEELFAGACDQPPSARARWLREHSHGDLQLLADVESLLEFDSGTQPELPAFWCERSAEADPETLGPFRVLSRIGQGGMGVVYHAEQLEPMRRRVALKVIRSELVSRDARTRFANERRALARLNHDAIARVLDCGATDDGRPWIAMELVGDGGPVLPLTDFCEAARLSLERRVRLFCEVCNGVDHAHDRKLVHRDLKPGNLLVAAAGEDWTVKIIDFGIARLAGEDDGGGRDQTDVAPRTLTGTFLGTPSYMAPEQFAPGEASIDDRTDVYALGIVLHELLAGVHPRSEDDFQGLGPARLYELLRDREPRRPSEAFTRSEGRADIAARRGLGVERMWRKLRGDLDCIVIKATASNPKRRYASVRELRDDLLRWIAQQPIHARPPSLLYRSGKALLRRRVQVAVASVLALATAVSLVLWRRADDALLRYDLLAAGSRLEVAELRAADLWPATPENVPAFTDWLRDEAAPLRAALPRVDAALLRLQEQAATLDPRVEDPHRRERREFLGEEVASLSRLVEERVGGQRAAFVAERQRLARLLALHLAEERTEPVATFADDRSGFLYDALGRLRVRLTRFLLPEYGTVADVESRLRWARSVTESSIERHRSAWQRASAAVSVDRRFSGVALTTQIGLVPLGSDPSTGLQEFAFLASGTVPRRDGDGRLVLTDDAAIVLVLLPPAEALIGCSADESSPRFDPATRGTEPLTRVRLDAFFIGKHEVTQAQWVRLGNHDNPSRYRTCRDGGSVTPRHPVERVSWDEAQVVLGHHGLALPTEAQWEYACRAGTDAPWSSGGDVLRLASVANLAGAEVVQSATWGPVEEWRDGLVRHGPVGSFAPNGFGLFDMHGNVAEWCRDQLAGYPRQLPGDGLLRPSGSDHRLVRGGSFQHGRSEARSAARSTETPQSRTDWLGLRAARAVR